MSHIGIEGEVAISPHPIGNGLKTLLRRPPLPVTGGVAVKAGTMATDRGGSLSFAPLTASEMERQDAWLAGRLVFQHVPISEVAKEFNRYNYLQMIITDPVIARTRIGGAYMVHEVDGFLVKLNTVVPIDVLPGEQDGAERPTIFVNRAGGARGNGRKP
jgi:hypothetical protein